MKLKKYFEIFKKLGNKKMSAELRVFLLSHKGNIRSHNEDNFYVSDTFNKTSSSESLNIDCTLKAGEMVCVFDGMGGEECGEIASKIAAETALDNVPEIAKTPCGDMLTAMLLEANLRVCEYADKNGVSSMGSTAVVLLAENDCVTVANLGDSRAYLFRKGELFQLSQDHTELQTMLSCGLLSPDEANLKKKTALTQYLGIKEEDLLLEPSIERVDPCRDDIYLLCSDGLTDMVGDKQIKEILKTTPFNLAAKKLLDQALKNGGRDNITIAIIKA